MKKTFFFIFLLLVVVCTFLSSPQITHAGSCVSHTEPGAPTSSSIVQCGQFSDCPCTLSDFFSIIVRIYNLMVWAFALPIGVLMIIIGGFLLIVSGIHPAWVNTGKKIMLYSVIGLALVFGSWLLVNALLTTIGYTGAWSAPF